MTRRGFSQTRQHGFTLLEVMVAVALTALMGAMVFAAIQSASRQGLHVTDRVDELKRLENTLYWLVRDVRRSVPLLEDGAAFRLEDEGATLLLGVRGQADPMAARPRALYRVVYRWQDGRLLRYRLAPEDSLENIREREPDNAVVMLASVQRFRVSPLSDTARLQSGLPAPDAVFQAPTATDDVSAVPRALWVAVKTERWGTVHRLIDVSGYHHD